MVRGVLWLHSSRNGSESDTGYGKVMKYHQNPKVAKILAEFPGGSDELFKNQTWRIDGNSAQYGNVQLGERESFLIPLSR
jgi:hypothetical protein